MPAINRREYYLNQWEVTPIENGEPGALQIKAPPDVLVNQMIVELLCDIRDLLFNMEKREQEREKAAITQTLLRR